MTDKEIREIQARLKRLEAKVDYVAVPKIIEEIKESLKKATNENEKKALQNQINNLNKRFVSLATMIGLYDAHIYQD